MRGQAVPKHQAQLSSRRHPARGSAGADPWLRAATTATAPPTEPGSEGCSDAVPAAAGHRQAQARNSLPPCDRRAAQWWARRRVRSPCGSSAWSEAWQPFLFLCTHVHKLCSTMFLAAPESALGLDRCNTSLSLPFHVWEHPSTQPGLLEQM